MASGSNTKKNSPRGSKGDPKLLITEWVIKPAATPRHVQVAFVVQQESDDGMYRAFTRRFLLQCENATELLRELKELLDDTAATQYLEEQGTSKVVALSSPLQRASARSNVSDADPLSEPFGLGAAYGLVGN
jgi:hypothetical protein